MLAAKGTSHTSSLEQPPPQKKQTSIVGLATRNATIAVASPEPLSSIEQPPPQKKQSSSAGLATICDQCVASPEPLSSIEQPPPQTKQASIAEEPISSRFQVASFYGAAQSAKNPSIEQPPPQNKQASKQRLEHTWAETWR